MIIISCLLVGIFILHLMGWNKGCFRCWGVEEPCLMLNLFHINHHVPSIFSCQRYAHVFFDTFQVGSIKPMIIHNPLCFLAFLNCFGISRGFNVFPPNRYPKNSGISVGQRWPSPLIPIHQLHRIRRRERIHAIHRDPPESEERNRPFGKVSSNLADNGKFGKKSGEDLGGKGGHWKHPCMVYVHIPTWHL